MLAGLKFTMNSIVMAMYQLGLVPQYLNMVQYAKQLTDSILLRHANELLGRMRKLCNNNVENSLAVIEGKEDGELVFKMYNGTVTLKDLELAVNFVRVWVGLGSAATPQSSSCNACWQALQVKTSLLVQWLTTGCGFKYENIRRLLENMNLKSLPTWQTL